MVVILAATHKEWIRQRKELCIFIYNFYFYSLFVPALPMNGHFVFDCSFFFHFAGKNVRLVIGKT